jgi:hypothetical protein
MVDARLIDCLVYYDVNNCLAICRACGTVFPVDLTTMQTVTCRQVTNKMVRTMICPPILKIWGGRGVTKFIRCIRPWSHADYCVEERKTSGFYYVISTTKNSRLLYLSYMHPISRL